MNWIFVFLFQFLLCSYIQADIYVRDNENNTQAVLTDYELSIGLNVPDEGILAVAQQADPTNACSALIPPDRDYPAFKNKSYKWFALVDRAFAYCDIQTKLINVMNASFDGVIIFNANVLNPMRYPMFVVNIPVILVSHSDGAKLARRYSYRSNLHLLITNSSDINYYQYLIPFLAVIGICLLVMLSFMVSQIIRCYHERKKEMKHRLSKKHLKKLPVVNFKKGDQYEVCAICLDEFTEGTKLRVLPCGHAYHLKCIDPWLTKNRRNCPICKGKVVVPGMSDTETDSEIENRNANSTERTPLISGNSSNYGLNPFARRTNRALGPFTSTWNSQGDLRENVENDSNSNEPEPTPSSSNGTLAEALPVEVRTRVIRTKKNKRTRLVNIQAEITPNQEIEESTSSSIPYEPLGEPSAPDHPPEACMILLPTVEDMVNSSNLANDRKQRRSDGIV